MTERKLDDLYWKLRWASKKMGTLGHIMLGASTIMLLAAVVVHLKQCELEKADYADEDLE